MMMRKLLAAIVLALIGLLAGAASAQFVPPPGGLYSYNGANWVANTNASAYGMLGYTPPAMASYCYNGAGWTPCLSTGGGGAGVSSIDTLTGAFTFGGPSVSHVGNAYTFTGGGAQNDTRTLLSAVCDGGVASASGLTRFDNNQPPTGCDLPASSTSAYMAFAYAATLAQYAQTEYVTPPYWTGTSAYVTFAGTLATGNVGWVIDTGCTNDGAVVTNVAYGTAATLTTTVSATTGAKITTAVFTNIAAPGTNGCTAGTTTPGSLLTVRIHRALTGDTQAGDAHLLAVTLSTARSQ